MDENITSSNLPVYVVNLERSKLRMEVIKKNLDILGIKYERFNAIDGKLLSVTDPGTKSEFMIDDLLSKKYSFEKGKTYKINYMGQKIIEYHCHPDLYRILSLGEIGCYLSHRGIYEIINKSYANVSLIIEDDILFENLNFNEEFSTILKNIPEDADVIYFLIGFRDCDKEKIKDKIVKVENNPHFLKIKPDDVVIYCLSSYIVTKKGAKIILELLQEKLSSPIDDCLGEFINSGKINSYKAVKSLCYINHEIDMDSEIDNLGRMRIGPGCINKID